MEICLIYPITLIYKPTTFQPLELKRYRFCMDQFHFITCLFTKDVPSLKSMR